MEGKRFFVLLLFIFGYYFEAASQSDSAAGASEAIECENTDFMIVVDGSGSVSPKDFKKMKLWIKHLADALEIDDGIVQIGVVQYSHWYSGRSLAHQTYMKTEIELGQYKTKTNFHGAVDKIKHQGYTTFTAHAINKTVDYDFQSSQSRYPKAQRVMILVTDGKASDSSDLPGAVRHAEDAGVVIFAVGVGGYSEQELLLITSNDRDRMFGLQHFDDLESIVTRISLAIACDCDPTGSLGGGCDACTRPCTCRPNAVGRRCEHCTLGYFKSTSGAGCHACECDVRGTVNGNECAEDTGKCVCLPNVVGMKCNACTDGYYGMTEGRGCEPCDCPVKAGSAGQFCDKETGRCE